ncbi:hypothetical protein AVEN_153659-1 [Araneus ventricosus]|uniref:Uncharacterized protein n=1 Tax=Araneus ventricosus TaxID=182803 RepID=A0A4Y2BPN8_ARAVE|nr:hypothetical protein AVEN_153659-1 [Araneus ventricosus]
MQQKSREEDKKNLLKIKNKIDDLPKHSTDNVVPTTMLVIKQRDTNEDCAIVTCCSLWNESADPAPQKEHPIPTKRNESADSDLLIPRHHVNDSESLIRIHNLGRGFVLFWNERYIIWGHGCRKVSSRGAGDAKIQLI